MRKFLMFTALTLALVLGLGAFGSTQSPPSASGLQVVPIQPISDVRREADSSPMIVIKYFPPSGGTASTSATSVAITANALTFVVNGAAYTGFECPVSGALGGVIDNSNAACNTVGEIVDTINSTPRTFATGYFRAAPAFALRSDDTVTADTVLADAADSDVVGPTGEIVYWKSLTLDDEEIGMWDRNLGANNWIGPRGVAPNPDDNKMTFVQYVGEKLTNAGTLSTFTCYAVKTNLGQGGGCNAALDCGQGSESVRTIYSEAAGATTVLGTSLAEFPYGFYAKDEKVFCRVLGSGADTSVFELAISGYTFPITIR